LSNTHNLKLTEISLPIIWYRIKYLLNSVIEHLLMVDCLVV